MTLTAQRMWGGAIRARETTAVGPDTGVQRKQPRCSPDTCTAAPQVVEDAAVDVEDHKKQKQQRSPKKERAVSDGATPAETEIRSLWRRAEGFVVVDSADSCALFAQHLDTCDSAVVAVVLSDGSTSFRPPSSSTTTTTTPKVLGIACLADTHPVPFFVPLDEEIESSATAAAASKTLESFLGSGARKVCYDAQQLWRVLADAGQRGARAARALEASAVLDTRLAAWVLDPDTPDAHLAFPELIFRTCGAAELPGSSTSTSTNGCCTTIAAQQQQRLLCADLHHCRALGTRLANEVREAGLRRGLAAETALAPVLAAMERAGCAFAPAVLAAARAHLAERAAQISETAARVVGAPVALASPRQVAHALYDVLRLAPPPSAAPGARHASTAEAALAALARQRTSPFPALVLDYRHCQKLLSTYILPFEERAVAATDTTEDKATSDAIRILRCQWRQMGTGTGRLSCANPNLQTIPRGVVAFQPLTPDQDAFAVNVRAAFVARPGTVFVVADYSQIELRVLAHFSRDQHLLDSFRRGVDFHRIVAAKVNAKAPAAVSSEERSRAKRVVFGVLYGMGTTKLAQVLSVPYREAERWKQSFFSNVCFQLSSCCCLFDCTTLVQTVPRCPGVHDQNHR